MVVQVKKKRSLYARLRSINLSLCSCSTVKVFCSSLVTICILYEKTDNNNNPKVWFFKQQTSGAKNNTHLSTISCFPKS